MAPEVFWHALSAFLYAALAFVAWLAVWGWMSRERLQRQPPAAGSQGANAEATPALSPQAQFAAVAAPPGAQWEQARRLRVQFHADGRIARALDDAQPG